MSSSFASKSALLTRMCDTVCSLIANLYSSVIVEEHTGGILVRPRSEHQKNFYILNEKIISSQQHNDYF